jgi:hypothetical protein
MSVAYSCMDSSCMYDSIPVYCLCPTRWQTKAVVRAQREGYIRTRAGYEHFILTLMAQAPSRTWVCGSWGLSIARRPCPYRGYLRLVWASVHAPSQYFPVPLRPLWLGGLLFLCRSAVLTLTLGCLEWGISAMVCAQGIQAVYCTSSRR